ncbi:MAG: DUF3015 domain-containing protein [Nitrospirota bacterium]|nr:DUF3015 domain-containing protein [Nitrospirota bacterium]
MRKMLMLVVVLVLSLTLTSSAFAYGSAGCGLGGIVIGNDPGWKQLVATFLNGAIFSNQVFGITTGTLGCGKPIWASNNDRLNQFVVANMDNLAKDIAMGKGETLDAFAELMEVPTAERAALYAKFQANFATIFPSENVVLADVVDNIVIVANN